HREAVFPLGLLERAPARTRHARDYTANDHARQALARAGRRTCDRLGDAMPTVTVLDTTLDVDPEGFLQKPEQWTPELGEEIARGNGIPGLTDRHWLVINYMRDRYLKTGSAPTIRTLGKEWGVGIKELYRFFPKGPAKLAAKIGGIPKPKGCISEDAKMTELIEKQKPLRGGPGRY